MSSSAIINCENCGGAPGDRGDGLHIICQFCGSSLQRPEPLVSEEPAEAAAQEPQAIRHAREIANQFHAAKTGWLLKLLGSIFLLLVLGLAICIGGPIAFGVNGYVTLAILSGLLGFALFVTGIICTVLCGVSLSKAGRDLQQKQRHLNQLLHEFHSVQ